MPPLTEPKVEQATNSGIIQRITTSSILPTAEKPTRHGVLTLKTQRCRHFLSRRWKRKRTAEWSSASRPAASCQQQRNLRGTVYLPWGRKDAAVDWAEGGTGNEQRHDQSHPNQQSLIISRERYAAQCTYLEDAKMPPLTEPKVEQATNSGIIQRITPSSRFPKV